MTENPDDTLKKLAEAAREAEPRPPAEVPPHLATRVLAARRERSLPAVWWEPFARTAAVTGCALAAVAWIWAGAASPAAADDPSELAASFLFSELEP